MPFAHFNVVNAKRLGPGVDTEYLVTSVPDVANRDSEPPGIGPSRSLKDRFFRAAASAAYAPELQNTNRFPGAPTGGSWNAGCELLVHG